MAEAQAVADIFEDHDDLVTDAAAGEDSARYRLVAKVMDNLGVTPARAEALVRHRLSGADKGIDVDGFEDYMDRRAEQGSRSRASAEAYVVSARKFNEWYTSSEAVAEPSLPPSAADVEAWLEHMALEEGLKGSSIQRHFHGIKAYFKYQGREGELSGIDVTDEYPDRGGGSPDPLDWDEVLALRRATIEAEPDVRCYRCGREWSPTKDWTAYDAPPRCTCDSRDTDWLRQPYDHAIVQLLSGFGMRVGELAALDVADVDPEAAELTIERSKRTEQRTDTMSMLEADCRAVRHYLDYRADNYPDDAVEADALFVTARRDNDGGWRAHTDYLRARLNAVAVAADVRTFEADGETKTEVYPHLLRHTVGNRLARANFSDYQVNAYLGHSNETTTSRYMSISMAELKRMREAIEDLSKGPGGS